MLSHVSLRCVMEENEIVYRWNREYRSYSSVWCGKGREESFWQKRVILQTIIYVMHIYMYISCDRFPSVECGVRVEFDPDSNLHI